MKNGKEKLPKVGSLPGGGKTKTVENNYHILTALPLTLLASIPVVGSCQCQCRDTKPEVDGRKVVP